MPPQDPNFGINKESLKELKISEAAIDAGVTVEEMRKKFEQAARDSENYFKKMFANIQEAEIQYLNYVNKAHKAKFVTLQQERKKALTAIVEQREAEMASIRKSGKAQKDKLIELAQLDEKYAKRREEIDNEHAARVKVAKKEAFAVEHPGLAKTKEVAGGVASGLGLGFSAQTAGIALLIKAITDGFNVAAESARTRGAFLGAGVEGIGGRKAVESLFSSKFLMQIGRTPIQAMGMLQGAAESPVLAKQLRDMVKQGDKALEGFIKTMGGLGIKPEEAMTTLTSATQEFGSSLKDTTKTVLSAALITRASNIHSKDSLGTLLKLQEVLRGVTFEGQGAETILGRTVIAMQHLGYSAPEITRMATALGESLGHLTVSQTAGMFAFARGNVPTQMSQLTGFMKNPLSAFTEFVRPLLRGVKPGSFREGALIQGLGEQYGIGAATTVKGASALAAILRQDLTGGKLQAALQDFAKENKTDAERAADLQKKGIDVLSNSVGILEKLANVLSVLSQRWAGKFEGSIITMGDWIPRLANALSPETVTKLVTNIGDIASTLRNPLKSLLPTSHTATSGAAAMTAPFTAPVHAGRLMTQAARSSLDHLLTGKEK